MKKINFLSLLLITAVVLFPFDMVIAKEETFKINDLQILYPSDLDVQNVGERSLPNKLKVYEEAVFTRGNSTNDHDVPEFVILKVSNDKLLTVNDWIKSYMDPIFIREITVINKGGKEIVRVLEEGVIDHYVYFLNDGSEIVLLYTQLTDKRGIYNSILNQLLNDGKNQADQSINEQDANIAPVNIDVATSSVSNIATSSETVISPEIPSTRAGEDNDRSKSMENLEEVTVSTTTEQLSLYSKGPQLLTAGSNPSFLTLPFATERDVTAGWCYNSTECETNGASSTHQGIDYSTGYNLDILASADGVARTHEQLGSGYAYGNYVFISHDNGYFTLYAHLADGTVPSAIPFTNSTSTSTWEPVERGEKIGESGDSGSPSEPHLHFEARLDNYGAVKDRRDPYDLRNVADYYPPNGTSYSGCGANHLWTECPPVPHSTSTGGSPMATTSKSGTITSNETWEEGYVYIVDNVTIASNATLTIDPGVIIKFSYSEASIYVEGELDVNGTVSEPVYFTSLKDDTVGGDSNNDGSVSSPAAGDWLGLQIQSGGEANLDHSMVRYGGNSSHWSYPFSNIRNSGGILSVSNSAITDSARYGIRNVAGTSTISNSELSHSVYTALMVSGGVASISSSTLSENTQYGAHISGGLLSFIGNTITNNGNAIYFEDPDFIGTHYNNSAFSNISSNGIDVYGYLNSDLTLSSDSIPYVINQVTITSNTTLTLDPGVIIKFSFPEAAIYVDGVLDINGTVSEPVYFTSFKDDTVGGDSNSDGSASVPAAGNWLGIHVQPGSETNIENTIVRYGGNSSHWSYKRSNIYNTGGMLSVSNSAITDSPQYAIRHAAGTSTISNSELANNGNTGLLVSGGVASIASSTLSGNAGYGAFIEGGVLSFTGNNFTSNGSAIYFGDPDFIGNHYGNSASSNSSSNSIIVDGHLTSNMTLHGDSIPYAINQVTITPNTTLTLDPGVIIKFTYSEAAIYVDGELDANGTITDPVYFTSFKDDTVGGDSNGDGSSSPVAGNWLGIYVQSGGEANLDHSIVRYGGNSSHWSYKHSNIYNAGGTLSLSSSTITNSPQYGIRHVAGTSTISNSELSNNGNIGLLVEGGVSSVNFNNNNIHDNSSYGLYNSSGIMLNSENNYWGHSSGPSGAGPGSGDAASTDVDYDPWLTSW